MAPGFIEQDVVVNAGRTSSLDIRVRPLCTVSGIVENVSTDALLKGVRVRLMDNQGKVLHEAITGEDGGYRFSGLSPGSYRVQATLPKGYIIEGEAERWVEATVGAETRVDFRVHRHGTVEGRVMTEQGQPLPDAEVALVDSTGTVVRTGRTNGQGAYLFADVPVDKYKVRVQLPENFSV